MTFFIKTYGCQMNVNDSEKIRHILESRGMRACPEETGADIVIINSCAVREKAQDKIYSYIGRLSGSKKVIVAGCVAQSEKEAILARSPAVDFILGTHQYSRIESAVDRMVNEQKREVWAGFSREWMELCPDVRSRSSLVSGYISIMEGCNNFCSYCIVPFTRGREKYRPFEKIVEEAEFLSDRGYRELVLLGQNVNNWRDPASGKTFPRLLAELSEKTRVRWIRFITSYPGYFDDELIEIMSGHTNIARHIHFPAQSGSTRLLKKMNRSYTRSDYIHIIDRFRKQIPEMKFSSDFIVGFPGESDRDFQLTMSLIRQIEYESVFSFMYSPRRHAKSSLLDDDVSLEKKRNRLVELQKNQEEIQLKNNRKLVGRVIEILVTRENPKKKGEMIGRTESHRVVNFPSRAQAGELRRIQIKSAGPHSLRGVVLDD